MLTRIFICLSFVSMTVPTETAMAGKPSGGGGGKSSCGDDIAKRREQCDGTDLRDTTCQSLGYSGGTLACDASCKFDVSGCTSDPVCGNDIAETGEACDRTDLRGETCQSQGYTGDSLGCTTYCGLDTSACTTGGGDPTCGDNTVGGYEECDGTADGACPGRCSTHCACPAAGPAAELELHMIDIGQGDGILVISPDGFVMLVDTGKSSHYGELSAYLSSLGIVDIDYTLVTHLHSDHFGAIDAVLADYPGVVVSFDNGEVGSSTDYDQYVASADTRRTTLSVGNKIDLGPSMLAEVLHAGTGSANENNNSVVVRLTYGSTRILLGGDCESACESSFDPGPIEIYKVHHHGSSSSSSEAFLDAMMPDVGLISVGAGNAYGHPSTQTLDRLAARNVTVFRTDIDGDLTVVADGSGYLVNGGGVCNESQQRTCGATDVGACAFGIETCSGGQWGACTGEVVPTAEVCDNSLDDDCDGFTDGADPDCGVAASYVVIAQVGYDTPGTDSVEEFIDLYNPTASPIALGGWTLSDNVKSWTIPDGVSIQPAAYLTIARNTAGFQALYGGSPDLDGLTLALNNGGDRVVLNDAGGAEVDRVAYENFEAGWSITAKTGESIERTDPTLDTDGVADWQVTAPATPRGGF